MENRKRVVIIAGPTASGKSALALELARLLDGVIINADSMQVYRDLAILTARPDANETFAVPHRLYGIFSGDEICSVGKWRGLALQEIAEAERTGRLPIFVGGTGLYLRALEEGLADIPDIDPAFRRKAEQLMAISGPEGFHLALSARDPATAATLRPSDRQRLVRAWEVLEATGQGLVAWQATQTKPTKDEPDRNYRRILCLPPRDWLYERINCRLETMLEAGGLAEIEDLKAKGFNTKLPVMKALGVPHFLRHLDGELALPEALAKAQQETRRYAKRQYLEDLPEEPYSTDFIEEIINFLMA
jgi:tRNA dimethylallyltransferase